AQNQCVAHVLLHFNDPHPANKVLKEGLYVCKEKLCLHKDKKEPIRCTKCQRWRHITANCHADHDMCTTCGGEHRTNLCDSHNACYCISCKDNNHSISDHHCPAYEQECEALDARHPENTMPYLPTNKSWT
ncbi:hypothetical protein PAXRUDRAFT_127704, partial [Paxillus rubicundulus Ve08.2h10]